MGYFSGKSKQSLTNAVVDPSKNTKPLDRYQSKFNPIDQTKGVFGGGGGKKKSSDGLDTIDTESVKLMKPGEDYQGQTGGLDLGQIYKAREYSNPEAAVQNTALNRRFDLLRDKNIGEANANAQTQNEALQRSLAAHGRIGSGVGQKQSQLLNTGLEKAKNNDLSDVESQREVGLADLTKQEADKKFAFNQEEAGKVFQSQEAYNQRGFAAQQAQRDDAFRTAQFNQSNQQFTQQMNMAIRQFNMDAQVTKFNQALAKQMANKKSFEDTIGTHSLGYRAGNQITGGKLGGNNSLTESNFS